MGRQAPTHIKEAQALQAPGRKEGSKETVVETGSLAEEKGQVNIFKLKRA